MMQKKITKQAFQLSLISIFFLSFLNIYAQAPCTTTAIATVLPVSGPSGTVVTLTGIGFSNGAGTTSVKFNGIEAAAFTVVSNTQITATAPATGTTGVVTIITNGCQATGPVFTYLQSNCNNSNTAEIYISELYDRQGGSYGVVELYNPSPTNTVTFTGQYVLVCNGTINGTANYTTTLTGSIQPEETYFVVYNTTGPSDDSCSGVTRDVWQNGGINENDQFYLKKDGAIIDEARAPNDNQPWYTVIRKPDAAGPNTAYSYNDWLFSDPTCDDLGSHTVDPTPPAVTITAQPLDQNKCLGENATFTVGLSSTTGVTYQWKTLVAGVWVNVTGGNYSGATTATLTVTGVTLLQNNTQYYCQITVSPTCTLLTEAVQLTVNPLPTATVTIVQPTCLLPTGIATLIPGTGLTLMYSLNGGAFVSNPVFSTLAPGTYNVTIQNAAGCTATVVVVINSLPLAPDVATTTVTQPTCTIATGTITVTAPLGTQYTYSINGGTAQASPVFAGLAPGSYTITTQNLLGCTSVTATIVVNPAPTAPPVATTTVIQPTCTTATGTITVSEITGIGYSYSINGGTPQPGTTFSGLAPGSYTITVQNADGCTSVTPAILINAAPNAPAVATTTVTQPDCTTPAGSITVTAPLGTEYTYSINGGAYQTGVLFPALAAGSYTISVQNTAGCTSVTQPVVINAAPVTPAVATTSVVQPDCTSPVASITVTAPVGTGYQYSINGGAYQSAVLFNNLAAGNYTITVQNADGCTAVTSPVTINAVPNAPAVATTTITQPDCVTATGTITVDTPTGIIYTYSLDGGVFQAGTTFAGVAPGSHTIIVKNTDGCTSITNVTVNPIPAAPVSATVSTTAPACGTQGGSINITAPLGTQYTYSIDGTTFQAGTLFTNLSSGNYTVTVQSAAGCTSTSATTINAGATPPPVATTAQAQPDCSNALGSITVTAPLGSFVYSLNNGLYQASPVFAGLNPGNYTITVQSTGSVCTSVTSPITINPVPVNPAAATTAQIQPDCATGTGSITISAPVGAGYSYSLNGGAYQTATTFGSLAPGSYTITVQTTGGCTSVTAPIIINTPADLPQLTGSQGCEATINGNSSLLNGLPVGTTFDPALVTYEWRVSGAPAIVSDDATFNVTQYAAANSLEADSFPIIFELTVVTAGGCEATLAYTVDGIFCDIPRGISPNNDTMNDNFDLTGLNVRSLKVFNRYGLEVYSKGNYSNEWFGQTNSGDDLPTGTYFYVIDLADTTKTGWVYINRQTN